MNHRTIGRIIAAMIIGIIVAVWFHYDHVSRGRLGREKFLAQQDSRFTRFYERPKPFAFELLTLVFATGAVFSGYELLALGLSEILKPRLHRSGGG
jgi:hypothetical protein